MKKYIRTIRRNLIPIFKLFVFAVFMFTVICGVITNTATRFARSGSRVSRDDFDRREYASSFVVEYNLNQPNYQTNNTETLPLSDGSIIVANVNDVEPIEIEDCVKVVANRGKSKIYNIPLSADLQQYAYDLCVENNVPFDIFIGLIKRESNFDPNAISKDGHDFGLCQIRDINFPWLTEKLGIEDFMDPKNNIRSSIYILSAHNRKYGDQSIHLALMCYNQGENGARSSWNNDIWSTKYSWYIVDYAKSL